MTRAEKAAACSLIGALAAAMIIPSIAQIVQEQRPEDRIIDALEEQAGLTPYDTVTVTQNTDNTYEVVVDPQDPPAFMNLGESPNQEYTADVKGWWDEADGKYIHFYPVVGETTLTPIHDSAVASWTAETAG